MSITLDRFFAVGIAVLAAVECTVFVAAEIRDCLWKMETDAESYGCMECECGLVEDVSD